MDDMKVVIGVIECVQVSSSFFFTENYSSYCGKNVLLLIYDCIYNCNGISLLIYVPRMVNGNFQNMMKNVRLS